MKLRTLGRLVAGCVLLVSVAGCDEAQAPPTTVVVNTPPDSGPVVLLTVMIAVAFLAVGAAVVFAWNWAQVRRTRREIEAALREAEDAVLALTGQPISRVRASLFRSAAPIERRALGTEGWVE
jgi:hypothetical protein